MSTFGFLTIGQSPRDDVLSSMLPNTDLRKAIQHGALDGLTKDEIAHLAPRGPDEALVTRLRDGSEVLVAKTRLLPYFQRAVERAQSDGADVLVILCTGAFPVLEFRRPTIFPDDVLRATVNALLPRGTIGVLMPHADQLEMMRSKWEFADRAFVGSAVSPYSQTHELSVASRYLVERGAQIVVMDCMGFTEEMKAAVAAEPDVPIILANRLVGRIIEEMMNEVRSGATERRGARITNLG